MARSLYARLDQRFGPKLPAFQRQRDLQNRIASFSQRADANIMFTAERAEKKMRVAVMQSVAGRIDVVLYSHKVCSFYSHRSVDDLPNRNLQLANLLRIVEAV
jgi:hypothetical protein